MTDIGVVFPQTEIGASAAAVRAYALGVEALGFGHVMVYDHVVGADPEVHQPWTGPYDVHTTFHEPFVLFGFLAGLTGLELVSGIIILPQRQTALVAKQAAEVDLLTDGRFRLGVGVGWNAVEYEALGKSFTDRGRRMDEQVVLLRRLWTETSVTHRGEFEQVIGAGLSPLPVQRPIPIWMGGQSAPAYRRIGRLADGWFPEGPPSEEFERAQEVIGEAAREAGRDPSSIGVHSRVRWSADGAGRVVDDIGRWRDAGASYVAIDTMKHSFATPEQHLEALAAVSQAL